MALAISNMPVLTGEMADRFIETAHKAASERGTIDLRSERKDWAEFEKRNAKMLETLKAQGWDF